MLFLNNMIRYEDFLNLIGILIFTDGKFPIKKML